MEKKGYIIHNVVVMVNNLPAWLKTITAIVFHCWMACVWQFFSLALCVCLAQTSHQTTLSDGKCSQTIYNSMAETKKSSASELWSGFAGGNEDRRN